MNLKIGISALILALAGSGVVYGQVKCPEAPKGYAAYEAWIYTNRAPVCHYVLMEDYIYSPKITLIPASYTPRYPGYTFQGGNPDINVTQECPEGDCSITGHGTDLKSGGTRCSVWPKIKTKSSNHYARIEPSKCMDPNFFDIDCIYSDTSFPDGCTMNAITGMAPKTQKKGSR